MGGLHIGESRVQLHSGEPHIGESQAGLHTEDRQERRIEVPRVELHNDEPQEQVSQESHTKEPDVGVSQVNKARMVGLGTRYGLRISVRHKKHY
jgi:hypothetical protein